LKLYILIVIVLISIRTSCQVLRQPLSTKYPALGAYSKNFSDVFSGTANQASLADLKDAAFAAYGEKRFLMDELKSITTIVAVPTSAGTFGLRGNYFGSTVFNESQLGLLYARKVAANVNVGVQFNYYAVRIPGYGTASTINFEAGAVFHLTEQLHTGFHIYNPVGSSLGKLSAEKLASVYVFGLGYEASDKLFVAGEIIKQEDLPVAVHVGLQFILAPAVFLRTGISTLNNNSYISVGLNTGFGRIDINTAYHPQLGFTPGLLLLIPIQKHAEGE
jgi:hypothetical protein